MTPTDAPEAPLALCGLLPHPPICVPPVARGRGAQCRATTDACAELARRLVARAPDRLVLVSPHSPRHERAVGLWSGARLVGDLSPFGAPEAAVELPTDLAFAERLAQEVALEPLPPGPLDHGALVPLWFLVEAGWRGPTTVLALPLVEDLGILEDCGRALARTAAALGGRTALVASGDMSHRVLPGAPAGHHPRAVELDHAVRDAVAEGRLADVARVDPDLRALAAEDVVASTALVVAALPEPARGTAVLSYEHPYGVGYLVAVLHDGGAG